MKAYGYYLVYNLYMPKLNSMGSQLLMALNRSNGFSYSISVRNNFFYKNVVINFTNHINVVTGIK